MNKSTSWGKVANWCDNLLENDTNSYQRRLILPNLLRLVEAKKDAEDKARHEFPLFLYLEAVKV